MTFRQAQIVYEVIKTEREKAKAAYEEVQTKRSLMKEESGSCWTETPWDLECSDRLSRLQDLNEILIEMENMSVRIRR